MKTVGVVIVVIGVIFSIVMIRGSIVAKNEYRNTISAPWVLADRASTIAQKAAQVDKFVANLEASGLDGKYNAVWLQNDTNSFDANLVALKTLQARLHEIETMDVTSPEYQWAIQQITGQEQGEASEMLAVFHGVWLKERYWFLWNWLSAIAVLLNIAAYVVGGILIYVGGRRQN